MKLLIILCLFTFNVFAIDKIYLTGSSTVAPLITEIAKTYELKNPNIRIDVQTGGSTKGVVDTRKARNDIGMASRAAKSSENDLIFHTLALDGIAIIVHKDNPTQNITKTELIAIYTGKQKQWLHNSKDISIIHKAEGRSTQELFLAYLGLKNSQITADIVIGDNEQAIKTLMNLPNGIGYVSIGTAEYHESIGTPIKRIQLEKITASTKNVKNASYPLSRKLSLVTKKDIPDYVKHFLDYSLSNEHEELIKGLYFVPLK